ncbi:MAG: 3-dehydroquinate synthase [Anaerolineaceae bacterium]
MKSDLIFLYGPPGSGKTTTGKTLAAELDIPFIDLDQEIVNQQGKSIPQLFSEGGETQFRSLEKESLRRLATNRKSVIALGGGILLDEDNRRLVEEKGEVIFLAAEEDILLTRLGREDGVRPLLFGDPTSRLKGLLKERRKHYSSFKNQVKVKGLTPDQIAWQIQVLLGRFHVPDPGQKTGGYDVVVRSSSLGDLGEFMKQWELKSPVMIVSDEHVAGFYLPRVEASLRGAGFDVASLVIPAGEENKNLNQVSLLWEGMLSAGLERGSTVVALGGGVVSDLAGFAASTFLRGLKWVVVPTSLLAMVDAGLGAKTGIDLPQGKNLVGAFHAPALVLIDPDVLATLPAAEFRSGLAEVIKHGLIGDPLLYRMCLDLPADIHETIPDLEEIIKRAVSVKVQVIREDPFENGRRAVLNLGHTIGHAVELVSGYTLRHGEAVSIGLAVETRMAEELKIAASGLSDTLRDDLKHAGLPVEIPARLDLEEIMRALKNDKKRANGKVRFALLSTVGKADIGIEIEEWRIRDAINSSFTRT